MKSPDPPKWHRQCQRCNKTKPLSSFRPKRTLQELPIKIVPLCAGCRKDTELISKFPAKTLDRLLKEGTITQTKYNNAVAERYRRKVETGTSNLKKFQAAQRAKTWEGAVASVNRALVVIDMWNEPEHCEAWKEDILDLLARAQEYIHKEKTVRTLNSERTYFWYDVNGDFYLEFRALLNNYPDGADKAPLQIL